MLQAARELTASFKEGQVEADGFGIRYMEAGQGNPVVILDSVTWGLFNLHNALAQRYRVVALEVPGFGSSPANTKSQSAKELANTMAHAAASLVPGEYTLIGTSFGANVALWQALLATDKVEALILISPTAILPNGETLTGAPEQLLAHPENGQALPAVDRAIFDQELALVHRLKGAVHDSQAESGLGEVQCSTLVVFGLEDRLVAPQAASLYREKIPVCNVSIVYDAGHAIIAERPEALINAVSDYVEHRETFIVGRQNQVINP